MNALRGYHKKFEKYIFCIISSSWNWRSLRGYYQSWVIGEHQRRVNWHPMMSMITVSIANRYWFSRAMMWVGLWAKSDDRVSQRWVGVQRCGPSYGQQQATVGRAMGKKKTKRRRVKKEIRWLWTVYYLINFGLFYFDSNLGREFHWIFMSSQLNQLFF